MLIGTVLMWTIPDVLISLFGSESSFTDVDPKTLTETGEYAFRIISLCFVPASVAIILITVFQAAGKGFRSMMMSFFRQIILLVPAAFLISLTIDVKYVWFAFPIAEYGALIIALLFFINLVRYDFSKMK